MRRATGFSELSSFVLIPMFKNVFVLNHNYTITLTIGGRMKGLRREGAENASETRKQSEDNSSSKKKGLGKWLLAPALALAASCADTKFDNYVPIPPRGGGDAALDADAQADASHDADTVGDSSLVDAGPDGDLDASLDAGGDASLVDAGGDSSLVDADVDSGVDAGGDASLVDAGGDSSLADSGSDADAGVACSGVSNATLTSGTFKKGTAVYVGGYGITYDTQTKSGITVDIGCKSSGAAIVSDQVVSSSATETVVKMPADGKKIRITLHSRNTWNATMTVTVENI
jgi:hypothetical protein